MVLAVEQPREPADGAELICAAPSRRAGADKQAKLLHPPPHLTVSSRPMTVCGPVGLARECLRRIESKQLASEDSRRSMLLIIN